MSDSLRKLIGTIVLVIFVFIYAIVVVNIGPKIVVEGTPWWAQLAFYATAGLAWTLPAGVLIKWMAQGGRGRP